MRPERILHVDDNEDMRMIGRVALEIVGGFELRQCNDGFSAVIEAKRFKPDLLLLDVMMPGLSGPETFGRISTLPGMEKVHVIYLTVKAQDDFAEKLLAEGALAVVPKPFDPMNLADQILELWKAKSAKAAVTNH